MSAAFYLPDNTTLATALAFGPTAAGATSAAQTIHFWYDKGAPGGAITNLSILAVNPNSTPPGLDSGVDWLDQTWIEARANGGANPSADPAFVAVTTGWYKLGLGGVLPLPNLPGDCAYYIELRLHPPMRAGAPTETGVAFNLDARYNESTLSLAGALSDLGQGIVTGIGDRTVTEFVEAPTVLATATPDALVHVSGRLFVYNGVALQVVATDDLTLDQNDSAAAALTTAHEYKAVISQPPTAIASVVTKGLLAATGASVIPALPAGNILIAVVNVAYHATASVIAQTDITVYAADGRGKPTIGTGLSVNVGRLRAILPGARIINNSARVVAVTGNASPITSYGWLGSDDTITVVPTDSTPPFAGASPLFSCIANATTVTSVTDLRVFFNAAGAGGGGGAPALLTSTGGSPTITGAITGSNTTFATSVSASTATFWIVFVDSGPDFTATWSGSTLTPSTAPIISIRLLYWS